MYSYKYYTSHYSRLGKLGLAGCILPFTPLSDRRVLGSGRILPFKWLVAKYWTSFPPSTMSNIDTRVGKFIYYSTAEVKVKTKTTFCNSIFYRWEQCTMRCIAVLLLTIKHLNCNRSSLSNTRRICLLIFHILIRVSQQKISYFAADGWVAMP